MLIITRFRRQQMYSGVWVIVLPDQEVLVWSNSAAIDLLRAVALSSTRPRQHYSSALNVGVVKRATQPRARRCVTMIITQRLMTSRHVITGSVIIYY